MPLRLLAGPVGSGKTTCLLDTFKRFSPAESLSSVRFVTPNLSHARRVRKLLLSDPSFPGFFGDTVLSLQGFASEIIRLSGLNAPALVGESVRAVLVQRVIGERCQPCFESVYSTPGFADAMVRAIGLLKQSGVLPDDLRVAVESSSQLAAYSREKLMGVAEVYASYQTTLEASGLGEPADLLRLALSATLPFKLVLFDGFLRFGPLERELVARLTRSCDVMLALDCDETGRFPDAESAIQFFAQLPDTVVERMTLQRAESAITHLTRSVFVPSAVPIPPDDSVTVFRSADRRLETEMVAREIRRLNRDGFTWQEIAVVCRGSRERQRVSGIMREYGIPIAEEYLPLSSSPLVTRMLRLMEGMEPRFALDAALSDVTMPTDERALREYNAAHRAIRRILDDMPDAPAEEVVRFVRSAVESRDYRLPGSTDEGLCITNPTGIAGRTFRAVFVTGLRDGAFPRVPTEDPIISYRERAELNGVLPFPLPLVADEEQAERAAFASCAASALDKLYLCADPQSSFLEQTEHLFAGPLPTREAHAGDILPTLGEAETLREAIARTVHDAVSSEDLSATATAYNALIQAGALQPDVFRWMGRDYSQPVPAYLRVLSERPEASE